MRVTLGSIWRVAGPVVYALVAGAVLILALGRNPLAFYGTTFREGLFSVSGLQQSIVRLAPLLLMAAGLIVAFQAGLWNVGGDGQFLMAAAMVGGLGAPMVAHMSPGLALILLCIIGFVMGAVWTLVPSLLKAWYGMNEIITSLMMAFIGINLANVLIKGPFLSTHSLVPQTNVVPYSDLLPFIPGTHIHVGIIVALVALGMVYYVQAHTAYGLRLRMLGLNQSAARHAGINVRRDIVTAFALSGGLIGLAAAVEILGVWGYVRADWNPGFGTILFAVVFLAGLNVLSVVPLVSFIAVVSIGGHEAARRAGLPNDFLLVLIGLILFFMVLAEWTRSHGRWARLRRRRPSPDPAEAERV
jgi:ABC-type uncharacterized transport system permease subunit